ncbi:23S rRNA (uridine(2552)-2'-O)-methyltransferase RlmE [Buchnera aphidicola]|uniref:23S rRNA (uridine(2552)-2'-O)-methyltransferase RlmE n=1 Tax=Buchnera aphidicola TaxID=9 RepID=UPI003BEF2399
MTSVKKSKSSIRWLSEHIKDRYVKEAKRNKIRSRAWFKLEQIDRSNTLFYSGMNVIDLGASPGSWSQYASSQIGNKGRIIACDILPFQPISGVNFIQGDLQQKKTFNIFLKYIKNIHVHMVMSDMAPNMTGHSSIDLPSSIILCQLALKISNYVLSKKGTFLVKAFQGDGFNEFYKEIKMLFSKVKICKPKTSRSRSREIFILAIR